MQTVKLVQGEQAWHDHRANYRNASESPVVIGCSSYVTYEDLVAEKATGIKKEHSEETLKRMENGHRVEKLALPLAEDIIGFSLSPETGVNGKYSASFDGIDFSGTVIFEHKSLNDRIRAAKTADMLPKEYRVQMEHQLFVSGADECLFMASSWKGDQLVEEMHLHYETDPALRKQIFAAWEQFEKDVANFKHVEVLPPVTAAPIKDLPALSIQVNGSISLISNLDRFGAQLTDFVNKLDMKPSTDQAFADSEAALKTLKSAEDALQAAEANALAQTADIDDMRKTVKLYFTTARDARLALEKMVKSRKESIRIEIVQNARAELAAHMDGLNKRLGKNYMSIPDADFAGAIKGQKTVSSLHEKCNQLLRDTKLSANEQADKIQMNLNSLRELASEYVFLFNDASSLVLKANDDLVSLIKVRIAEHKAAEAAKEAALRARLQAEEEAKARAKIEAEERAKADAEAKAKNEAAIVKAVDAAPEVTISKKEQAQWEKGEKKLAAQIVQSAITKFPDELRPSDEQIIEALALHFRVHELKICEWLIDMDMNAVTERMSTEFI